MRHFRAAGRFSTLRAHEDCSIALPIPHRLVCEPTPPPPPAAIAAVAT